MWNMHLLLTLTFKCENPGENPFYCGLFVGLHVLSGGRVNKAVWEEIRWTPH